MLALPCAAAPVERRQNADGKQHSGTGITEGRPGFERRAVVLPGDAHDTAGRLCDHVEGEVVLVGAAGTKAFHLCVDDARVYGAHDVVAEPQALNGARREILHHHIGAPRHVLDEREPALRLQVDRDGFLVGVEQQEIPGVIAFARRRTQRVAARLPALRVFHLDNLGAEPGQRLRTGWAGLELGQVQNSHAGKTARQRAVGRHLSFPPLVPPI